MSWPLGLSTGIAYQHPIEAVLETIRDRGVRRLEVATAPSHLDLHDAARVSRLARRVTELGLAVHSLHAPFGTDVDLTDPDPRKRHQALERLTLAADALRELGGRIYVIHPGGEESHWIWEREERLARSVEGLNHMWEVCRERGLILTVETPLPHLLGGQLDDFAWLLERVPMNGTGVCVDTSHCTLGGFLFPAIERFAGRLVHIQASDNHGVTDDHLPPGDGRIEWPKVLAALERAEYRGVFLLEVAGNGDLAAHCDHVIAQSARVLPTLSWRAGHH